MNAIRVHRYGGPEVLEYEDVEMPEPGEGQARVRTEAAGLNYIDVYQRSGVYRLDLPFTPGMEGGGMVDAVGPGVSDIRVGQRVAYAMVPGSYAGYAVLNADRLVPVPDDLDIQSAVAATLQGMTAHYLACTTYPLGAGDTALVHAAAGGVGLLLVQIAKRRGATVFGTVSTEEKAELARAAGADEVILYTEKDFTEEVKKLTGGRGLSVVYDSVGKSTFEKSLDCLRPRGYLVLYGNSSGVVPPFDLALLARKGSLFITRPSLAHYTLDREELLARARELFQWIEAGELELRIGKTFPLEEAAEAHRQIEARETTGKVLLIP